MNILSLHESENIAHEADSLCSLIDSHTAALREVNQGESFRLEDAFFQLFQQDRNTIYRIKKRFRWFLKMPHHSTDDEAIKREIIGAEIIRDALGTHPFYSHACAIRGSVTQDVEWFREIPSVQCESTLIHGNLGPTNVLVCDDKVCFIDFENFGRGLRYHDLSLICYFIMLTHALSLFPSKHASLSLSSLLKGYKEELNYQPEILLQYLTILICCYYLQTCCSDRVSAKIAGIPVNKSRLRNLVMAMLDRDIDSAFPGIDL